MYSENEIRELIAQSPTQGVALKGIPSKDYHSMPGISSSDIKAVLNGSIRKWLHSKNNPTKKYAFTFGNMIHCFLLENDQFFNRYFTDDQLPKAPGRNTKDGKEIFSQWCDANFEKFTKEYGGSLSTDQWQDEFALWQRPDLAHMERMTKDEHEILKGIKENFDKHEVIQKLYSHDKGDSEVTMFWIDENTNILCKCRPDRINWEWPCVLDIKSTMDADLDAFQGQITELDYHVSAAFYLEGTQKVTGKTMEDFIYTPVEKVAPFEVTYYIADPASIDTGSMLFKAGLEIFKRYFQNPEKYAGLSKEAKLAGIRPYKFNALDMVIEKHDLHDFKQKYGIGV